MVATSHWRMRKAAVTLGQSLPDLFQPTWIPNKDCVSAVILTLFTWDQSSESPVGSQSPWSKIHVTKRWTFANATSQRILFWPLRASSVLPWYWRMWTSDKVGMHVRRFGPCTRLPPNAECMMWAGGKLPMPKSCTRRRKVSLLSSPLRPDCKSTIMQNYSISIKCT